MRLRPNATGLVVLFAVASAGLTAGTQRAHALSITIPEFQATASDPSVFFRASGGDLAGSVSAPATSDIVLTVSSFTIDIDELRNAASWSSLSVAVSPIDFGGGRMFVSLAREEPYEASFPGVSAVFPAGSGTYRINEDGLFRVSDQNGAFATGQTVYHGFLGSEFFSFGVRFSWFLSIEDLAEPGALGNLRVSGQVSTGGDSVGGTDPVTGDFLFYSIGAAGGFGVDQGFTVVPEPSSGVLALIGLGWLAVGRRPVARGRPGAR